MPNLDARLAKLKTDFDLELHESFIAFLNASESIYGNSQSSLETAALKSWEGISTAGPAGDPVEDEYSEEYLVKDIAVIFRLDGIVEMLTEGYLWSPPLSSIGYPIAQSYGGAVYFQGVDGEIWKDSAMSGFNMKIMQN